MGFRAKRKGATVFRGASFGTFIMGKAFLDGHGKPVIAMHQLPNGLWAIDLECEEAQKLARYFLPFPLQVLDRPGKPNSRWLYRFKPK
jgi:hypothetical protein